MMRMVLVLPVVATDLIASNASSQGLLCETLNWGCPQFQVYTYPNGDQYAGYLNFSWVGNKLETRHGKGTYHDEDGIQYIGEWNFGVKHGHGTYIFGPKSKWAGDKYVGEWTNGEKHGQGTYTYGSKTKWAGDKYVGHWRDGKKEGQGTYFWANGDQYVGSWKNDKRQGGGVFSWTNGDTYHGSWTGGKMSGKGTYTYADRTVSVGEWVNGKFQFE